MSPTLRLPTSRRLIGIAVGETAWQLAEVSAGSRGLRTLRTSAFTPPENWTQQGDACGEALAAHLKAEGYTARQLAFGVDNRHLFARHRPLPPTPHEEARRGAVRIMIEKEHGGRRLAFDFLRSSTPGDAQDAVLLVAINDRLLGQLREVARAAQARLVAVTATSLAIASAVGGGDADGVWARADEEGIDLTTVERGRPTMLSRLPLRGRPVSEVVSAHLHHVGTTTGGPRRLRWVNHDAASLNGDVAGVTSRVETAGDSAELIARSLLSAPDTALNFASSRLEGPSVSRVQRFRRPALMASAVLLALVLGVVVWGAWGYRQNQQLREQYERIADRAAALQTVRDRTSSAAPWFDQRPATIGTLATLTECFPRTGRVWVTNLRLSDTGEGSLQGRADSKPTMLACVEAMQAEATLYEVQLRDWNQADRTAGTVGFEIVFVHRPEGEGG